MLLAAPHFGLGPELMRYWTGTANMLPQAAAEGRRVLVVSNHPDYLPPWVGRYGRLEACFKVDDGGVSVPILFEVKPRGPEAAP